MQTDPPVGPAPRAPSPRRRAPGAPGRAVPTARPSPGPTPQEFTAAVAGRPAEPLLANLPDAPSGLDPHYADLAPVFDSRGAAAQLGGISRQALSGRRRTGSVLAMRAGNGNWVYPAWQFTGAGTVHPRLTPVLRALRPLDPWAAGVWLASAHPNLGGRSPRTALGDGQDPQQVAALAAADAAALTT